MMNKLQVYILLTALNTQ